MSLKCKKNFLQSLTLTIALETLKLNSPVTPQMSLKRSLTRNIVNKISEREKKREQVMWVKCVCMCDWTWERESDWKKSKSKREKVTKWVWERERTRCTPCVETFRDSLSRVKRPLRRESDDGGSLVMLRCDGCVRVGRFDALEWTVGTYLDVQNKSEKIGLCCVL